MKRINILFIFILVFRPQLSPNKVIYWKVQVDGCGIQPRPEGGG